MTLVKRAARGQAEKTTELEAQQALRMFISRVLIPVGVISPVDREVLRFHTVHSEGPQEL